jgi:hypothetical protein
LFTSPGKKRNAKMEIRAFNGFPIKKKKARLDKVLENKKKWTVSLLKDALGIFSLDTTHGPREELATRLVDYLQKPFDAQHGEKGSAGSKKRKASGNGDKKSSATKKKKIVVEELEAEVEDDDDVEVEDDDEVEEEDEDEVEVGDNDEVEDGAN